MADPLVSLEYAELEVTSHHLLGLFTREPAEPEQHVQEDGDIETLTQQIRGQTSLDNRSALATADTVNDNEGGAVLPARHYSQHSLLSAENINYDVLCAIAGTTNLGSVRNFTARVRCPGPRDSIQKIPRLMPFITSLYLDNSEFVNFR